MDRDRDRRETWPPEPEVASASGGHLAPEPPPTSPLDALSSSPEPPWQQPPPDPSMAPTQSRAATVEGRARRPRRRVPIRRVKRTLRHVDPKSILRLSLFYSAAFMVVWLIVVAILYGIVNSLGMFDAIESLSRALALGWRLDITLGFVLRWAFVFGLFFSVIFCLINLVIAILYNVAADVVGGAEMTFVEREM
jgi:hypothetical protein